MKPITKQIRAERRAKAEKMQAAYAALSIEEKIAKLPINGAKRQWERFGKVYQGDGDPTKLP